MNEISTINLKEWNVTYTELVRWCEETGADVYAIIHHGGNWQPSAQYGFEKGEDLLAFTLTFSKRRMEDDMGFYYCPYIPLFK